MAAIALALPLAVMAVAPAAPGVPQDTIVMGKSIDDIVSLDPAEVYEVSGSEVVGNVYDRLLEVDPAHPDSLRPGLARDWRSEDDGRRFVFTLRPEARFASGAEVTAADVAFSLQRAVHLDKAPALILSQLGLTARNVEERVRVVDPLTVTIELATPLAPDLVYFCLTAPVASIVERQAVLSHAQEGDLGNLWLASHSAGSGAYRLELWRPAEKVMLIADRDYWGGAPANRRIILRHLKEPGTERLMLEGGDLDYARDLDADQLSALAREPTMRIDRGRQSLITYLALNQDNRYLRRPEVVEAIKYLVDYEGIRRALLGETRVVHQSFEPLGMLGALADRPFAYDPVHAKALLAKAGLAEGFAVTIDVRSGSPAMAIAQALQAGFAEADIALAILPGDGKQVLTKYRARRHEIFIGEWGPDYPDPHSNAEAFALNEDDGESAARRTPAWRTHWHDAAMNDAVRTAMFERDRERRIALYETLQRAHQEAAPFVFLFQHVESVAHRASVDGFVIGFGAGGNRYAGIAKH